MIENYVPPLRAQANRDRSNEKKTRTTTTATSTANTNTTENLLKAMSNIKRQLLRRDMTTVSIETNRNGLSLIRRVYLDPDRQQPVVCVDQFVQF